MNNKIVIINLEVNNIFSIHNILQKLSDKILISNNPNDILDADKLILPGNGNFGNAISKINDLNIKPSIQKAVNAGVPTLGICLGMQLFLENSEESNNSIGLEIIKGSVEKRSWKKCCFCL